MQRQDYIEKIAAFIVDGWDAADKGDPVQLDPGKTKKKTLEDIESGKKKSPEKENDGKEIL